MGTIKKFRALVRLFKASHSNGIEECGEVLNHLLRDEKVCSQNLISLLQHHKKEKTK
jgi:hypothetical protein